MISSDRFKGPLGVLCLTATLTGGLAWAAGGDFALRTPTADVSLNIQGDQILGANHRLGGLPDALRGQAYGRSVDLSLKEGRVSGLMGENPVNLKITEEGDVVTGAGLFGGQISRFTLSPEELTGRIGRCSYDLKHKGGAYLGFRQCGSGRLENTTVRVPAGADAASPEALAAVVALLVGG